MEEKIEDLVVKGVRAASGSIQPEIPSSSSSIAGSPTIFLSGYSTVLGTGYSYFWMQDSFRQAPYDLTVVFSTG